MELRRHAKLVRYGQLCPPGVGASPDLDPQLELMDASEPPSAPSHPPPPPLASPCEISFSCRAKIQSVRNVSLAFTQSSFVSVKVISVFVETTSGRSRCP